MYILNTVYVARLMHGAGMSKTGMFKKTEPQAYAASLATGAFCGALLDMMESVCSPVNFVYYQALIDMDTGCRGVARIKTVL